MEATKETVKKSLTVTSLKKDARKAYYSNKVDKFLARMLEKKSDIKELAKVKDWFQEFQDEEVKTLVEFKDYLPKTDKAPTSEELFDKITPEIQAKTDIWVAETERTLKMCIDVARKQREKIQKGDYIDSKEILNLGLSFFLDELWFNDLLSYREVLYKKKIIKLIDGYNISRREAQDRAEITSEYFEYIKIKRKLETLGEIAIYAKKYQETFK